MGTYNYEGTHRTHCCSKHYCKYYDKDCPVTTGKVKQDHPCESCAFESEAENEKWIPVVERLPKILTVCLVTKWKREWKRSVVTMAYFDPHKKFLQFVSGKYEKLDSVIAWREMPPAYDPNI